MVDQEMGGVKWRLSVGAVLKRNLRGGELVGGGGGGLLKVLEGVVANHAASGGK